MYQLDYLSLEDTWGILEWCEHELQYITEYLRVLMDDVDLLEGDELPTLDWPE